MRAKLGYLACLTWLLMTPGAGQAAATTVSAGLSASLYLNSDGSVWGTGNVANHWPGAVSPVRVFELSNVVAVATNGGTNFAVLAGGSLWGYGGNHMGLLADGTTEYRPAPMKISGVANVKAVEARWNYVLVLKHDGTVWAWGKNDRGQLGDGTKTDRYTPGQVAMLTSVVKISASDWGALALKADGTVWVWGWTCCGAAGNGINPSSEADPEQYRLVPSQVHLDQAVAIAAGHSHHMALRADGTVWSWGYGELGQNGRGTTASQALPAQVPGLSQFVAIHANGNYYSVALRADGTVWAWGNNAAGQLGVTGITYSSTPIQVPGVSNVVAIAAGEGHVLAMKSDGTVLAWGRNSSGQLGDNTLEDHSEPQAVLGPGASGQLNLAQPAPSTFNRLPSAQIDVNANSGTAPLSVKATATNAIDEDGTIVAHFWQSSDGQLGSGSSTTFTFKQAGTYYIDLLIEDNAGGRGSSRQQIVVAPAAGAGVSAQPKIGISNNGSVALANDGRILTWGPNWLLGLYDSQAQFLLPDRFSHPVANGITGAVDVAIGSATIHVVLADGSVLGWGGNNSGEVGSGTNACCISVPQLLPGLPPARALAAKWNNYLALTRDGKVFSWGSNIRGALGLDDYENRFQPVEISGLENVAAIAVGYHVSAALKTDGTVWAWGSNEGYEMGDGTQTSRNRPGAIAGLSGVVKIFISDNTIFSVKGDGTTWVTGHLPVHIAGDPGPSAGARHVPAFDGIAQIAGDYQHVCAISGDGSVWTGGQQSSMALGFEATADIPGLRQLAGISDGIWVSGSLNGCMVARRDGTVVAWGRNDFGQLGDGTLAFQISPVLVVNEAVNGPLDLVPEVANNIPQNLIPPFFLATYSSGGLDSTSLFADLRGVPVSSTLAAGVNASNASVSTLAAEGYNVYVAANVPTGTASQLYQLHSDNNWSALTWPMADFKRGVALDSQDSLIRVQILQNVNLTPYVGASILVGYGTDPDEMLSNSRYRTIFTVTPQ